MAQHENAQMAHLTLQMLKRVELKGSEVPAFVEINNWLQAMVPPMSPAPAPTDATGMENPAVPPETQR